MRVNWLRGTEELPQMTAEEFDKIKGNKNTPDAIFVDGVIKYNEYTCLNSYRWGGNCNCLSHPSKKWVSFPCEVLE